MAFTLRAKHICGVFLCGNGAPCLPLLVLHVIGSCSEVRLLVDKWPSGALFEKSPRWPKPGLEIGAQDQYSLAVCKY